MKRKYSKAMRIRVGTLTQQLFEDAVREIVGPEEVENEQDLADTIMDLRWAGRHDPFQTVDEQVVDLYEQKKKVDELYLKKITSLSESQLQEIMICHNEGEIKRAPLTIQAILSELAARSIFDDSSQSESKNNDGGVYESKQQGKRHSKKTNKKGSKTTSS